MVAKLCEYTSGQERYLVISDEIVCKTICKGNGYDLARKSVKGRNSLEHLLHHQVTISIDSLPPEIRHYFPPLMPEECVRSTVSSFGNTHIIVNGNIYGNKPLDWFYKGNGASLKTTGSPLILPIQGHGGGVEIEYAIVVMANETGVPIVIGYTLALDFSDVIMRHLYPNLAGLSKLTDTFVAHEMILASEIPISSNVTCVINRGKNRSWEVSGTLGSDNMNCSVSSLLEHLVNTNLFQPHCVHYVLLGAAISTHKGGYNLEHGDVIEVRSQIDGLSLCCRYEDDAFNYACI